MVLLSFAFFSFSTPEGAKKSKTNLFNPMFGSDTQCLPPIILPGGCTQECRSVTYIFWIAFYGNWNTEPCSSSEQ